MGAHNANKQQQQQVIDALEPHPNVEKFIIKYYTGNKLPDWIGNPSVLKSVVTIELSQCRNCSCLPALEQLPCLKRLYISEMERVEYMISSGNNNIMVGFPSLEILEILNLRNLKGFSKEEGEEDERIEQQLLFPRLKTLSIEKCPKLTFQILPQTLESFDTSNVTLPSIPRLANLKSLVLNEADEVITLPYDVFKNLSRLETLEIISFRDLKVLPEEMSSLVALKKLRIIACKELEFLPDGGIRSLRSLLEMGIDNCPRIVCLPDSIQTLTQLQSLELWHCSPELKRRCENDSGQDWQKIAHIPNLCVGSIRVR